MLERPRRRWDRLVFFCAASASLLVAPAVARAEDEGTALDRIRETMASIAKSDGPDSPRLVTVERTRSTLASALGGGAEAVDAAEDALRITRLGKPTPADVATDENLLGVALLRVGRFVEAERHLMAASAAVERAPRSALAGEVWTNLGDLSLQVGYPQGARRWLDRAQDALSGPGHDARRGLVHTYEQIADLAGRSGVTDEELRFGGLALSLAIEEYGPDHEEVGRAFAAVGSAILDDGRPIDADPVLRRAVDVLAARLGADHPDLAHPRVLLAFCLAYENKPQEAAVELKGAFRAEVRRLEALVPRSRPQDLRRFLDTTLEMPSVATGLALTPGLPPELVRDSLSIVLARKSLDMDVERAEAHAGASRDVMARLTASRAELARALLQGTPSPEELGGLERTTGRLEVELGRVASASPGAPPLVRTVDAAEVARALPPGSALVEMAVYHPLSGLVSDPRVAAYVLRPDGSVVVKDLGVEAALGLRVTALRTLVQSGQPSTEALAAGYVAMVQPWADAVDKREALFVAADGPLTLVPFEILVRPDGKALLDTARVTYLTSGRDLVDLAQARPLRADLGGALLVGDPDYDRPVGAGAPASSRQSLLGGVRWPRLPGTAQEVEALAKLLPGATVRLGADAGEGALASAGDKRIVHLATHGFFLDSAGAVAKSRGLVLDPGEPTRPGVEPSSPARVRVVESLADHPDVRSGLVLAGANTGGGYLTASQLEGVDLSSADLVVLSACETAVGEISFGLGVTGLRRSLAIAGARSEVISLWKVDDAATAELMKQFYGNVSAGMERSQALRAAKVSVRAHPEWSAPYFWGAFQLFGDWRPVVDAVSSTQALRVMPRGGCGACTTAATADPVGGWPLAAAAGLGLVALLRRRRARRYGVVVGVVAAAGSFVAASGVARAADPPPTMAEALALSERSAQLTFQGDYPRALVLAERALRIEPDNDVFLGNAASLSRQLDRTKGRAYYLLSIEAALSVGARQRAQNNVRLLDEMADEENASFHAGSEAASAKLGTAEVTSVTADIEALMLQALTLRDQSNFPAAVAVAQQAEAMCRQRLPNDLLRLVRVQAVVAGTMSAMGRADGIQPLKDGIAKLSASLGSDNAQVLSCRENLAQALATLGRKDEALPIFEAVAADATRILKDRGFALIARSNLITWYTQVGRSREAVALGRQTLEPCRKEFGPHSGFCLQIVRAIATGEYLVGNMPAAREAATRALLEDTRLYGMGGSNLIVPRHYTPLPESTNGLQMLSLLGNIDLGPGKHDDPVRAYEVVLLERERAFGRSAMPTLRLEYQLAMAELQAGKKEQAGKHLLDLHRRVDGAYGEYSPMALEVAMVAETILAAQGHFKEIAALVTETSARARSVMGPSSEQGITALFNEGFVKSRLGWPEGAGMMRQAAAQAAATMGAGSPLVAAMQKQALEAGRQ